MSDVVEETLKDTAMQEEKVQRGHHLMLVAFGGGMVWGSALLQL